MLQRVAVLVVLVGLMGACEAVCQSQRPWSVAGDTDCGKDAAGCSFDPDREPNRCSRGKRIRAAVGFQECCDG